MLTGKVCYIPCKQPGCGRWRPANSPLWYSGQAPNNAIRLIKPFELCDDHISPGERPVGTYSETDDKESYTVVYCLFEGCRLTRWLPFTRWEISLAREEGVKSGEFEAVSGPFCPDHSVGGPELQKGVI